MGRVSKPTPQFPYSKGLMPQEEMLETGRKNKRITVGIPKEADTSECRIPLTPEAVEMLVEEGDGSGVAQGGEVGAGEVGMYAHGARTIAKLPAAGSPTLDARGDRC